MARDRARSSFTVEVRRDRSTPVETDPKRALWRGHDLAGEAARHEAMVRVEPAAPVRDPVAARDSFAARDPFAARIVAPHREAPRILPSLIQAPAPAEEDGPAPEPEARLPRVRRVRPRVERPAPEPVPAGPDPDEVFGDLPEAVLADGPAAPADLRLRRRQPRERVLRAGERWKRRLPRALW